MKNVSRLFAACVCLSWIVFADARDMPLDINADGNDGLLQVKPWSPLGCTRKTYENYARCDKVKALENQARCYRIAEIASHRQNVSLEAMEMLVPSDRVEPCLKDDMLFFPSQTESFLRYMESLEAEQLEERSREKRWTHGRVKRNSKLTSNFKINRWPLPIKYKIDGYLVASGKSHITAAIKEWEKHTCVRFEEIDVDETPDEHHLVFLYTTSPVCYSYIGKTDTKEEDRSQPIFLSPFCMSMGVLAHELGHVLGLVHEHQRPDRDEHINIVTRNVKATVLSSFLLIPQKYIDNRFLPYDYASNMHYISTAFSSNGLATIKTKDARFQATIGQRVELSFWDTMAINLAYCTDECKGKPLLREKCAHRGYQDPNHCDRCKCPDGLAGTYCEEAAPPVRESCGGNIDLTIGEIQHIETPNLRHNRAYENGQECSWLIKAPVDKVILAKFEGRMDAFCGRRCQHWIEIRSDDDIGLNGPRYCCNDKAPGRIQSKTNQMLVTFRAKDYFPSSHNERWGFRMSLVVAGGECPSVPCLNGGTCTNNRCACPFPFQGDRCENGPPRLPPRPSPKPTTTPTTTTTTATTTTTTTTTTPRPIRLTDPPVIEKPRATSDDLIDLVFVLDVSSRERKDMGCLKSFIKTLTRRFNYGISATRIGLVTFDRFAHSAVFLSSHRRQEGLLDDISDQELAGSNSSNYYMAVWLLIYQTFLTTKGARRNTPHIAVFVTDNSPSNSHLKVFRNMKGTYIQKLRDEKIQIVAVGVGDMINTNELLAIAGSERFYYHPSTCRELLSPTAIDKTYNLIQSQADESRRGIEKLSPPVITRPPTRSTSRASTANIPSSPTLRALLPRTTTTQESTTTTTTPQTTTTTTTTATTTTATTTTTTTTTQRPKPTTNTPTRTSTCQWEKRTNCSDTCGGCGVQRKVFVCHWPDGTRKANYKLMEPCNFRPCVSYCQIRVGRGFETKPCDTYCCHGYRVHDGVCVKTKIPYVP